MSFTSEALGLINTAGGAIKAVKGVASGIKDPEGYLTKANKQYENKKQTIQSQREMIKNNKERFKKIDGGNE